MTPDQSPRTDRFPKGLSQPALRALHRAGYMRLEDVAGVDERDLLALHGLGPKAIPVIDAALRERGLPPLAAESERQ